MEKQDDYSCSQKVRIQGETEKEYDVNLNMCCLQIPTTKLKTGVDTSGLEYQVFYYRLEVLLNFPIK